jgi:hypothetical protein
MTGFQSIRRFRSAAVLSVVLACAACGGGSSGTGKAGSTGSMGNAGSTGSAGSTGGAGIAGTAGKTGTAGSTTGAGGAPTGTPVALCKQLISTICMRLQSCNALADPTKFVEADCERFENVEFGCDRATSTAFPDCVNDARLVSCASLFTSSGLNLPGSCGDPVNTIPLSTAQSKCADLAAADCTRLFQCANVSPTADDLQNCQIIDYGNAGCGFATDVGATYNQCLMDLGTAPCPVDGGTQPDGGLPSCDNAIVFVQ